MFPHARKRSAIFAERPHPYIARRGKSLLRKREPRLHPTGKQRPRIWTGSPIVNKRDTRYLGGGPMALLGQT